MWEPSARRVVASRTAGRVSLPDASLGTVPLAHYYRAWLCYLVGDRGGANGHLASASAAAPDYCFPARLDEISILRHAIGADPTDPRAHFYLGNLLYDRRRHAEAIGLWERTVKLEPANAVAWRNLGIGYVQHPRPAEGCPPGV